LYLSAILGLEDAAVEVLIQSISRSMGG
jgi:hypothetical protein